MSVKSVFDVGRRPCGLISAQREATRIRKAALRSAALRVELVEGFQRIQMGRQFVQAGPALEMQTQHFVSPFGRFAAGPQGDQSAKGGAISAV